MLSTAKLDIFEPPEGMPLAEGRPLVGWIFKRALKNQEFCLLSKLEEDRNRSLLAISEDCDPTKMKTAGKTTVLCKTCLWCKVLFK